METWIDIDRQALNDAPALSTTVEDAVSIYAAASSPASSP